MDEPTLQGLRRGFEAKGFTVEDGLTDAEIAAVERRWSMTFPPDLRQLLETFLLVGPEFPNWRVPDDPTTQERMSWPAEGVRFDVDVSGFWLAGWGERPSDAQRALQLANDRLAEAPVLVPVYGHRYLPTEPLIAGNPVLSVYQTDIIVYGSDLEDYIWHEFRIMRPLFEPSVSPEIPWDIPFWGDILTYNNTPLAPEQG